MQLLSLKQLETINKKALIKMRLFLLLILLSLTFWFIFLDRIHYECPFFKFLHVYCPGCGGMRMIHSLLKFDFYQAFRYNPLLFIFVILGIVYCIINIILYIKKKEVILPSINSLIIILIILIIYMILRNISIFSFLIPTRV